MENPRQSAKVKHNLVELLVAAVNAVLVGAGPFVEIELWAEEKLKCLDRLRQWKGLRCFAALESA